MKTSKLCLMFLVLVATGCAAEQNAAPIYNEQADARQDIAAAVTKAEGNRKNIVLIFGANWCGDCHALHAQMQKSELASIIERNFVVVDIDLGRWDKNLDVADQYHVPIKRGIPALAVLDSHGKLLYAMDQGQFADARSMSYESIKAFFVQWEPKN
jgi:thioredoxin 1